MLGPQCSEIGKMVASPSGSFQKCCNVTHMVHLLPSSGRRSWDLGFFPTCSVLSWGMDYGDTCVLVQTAIFVLLVPRHVVYAQSCQWSERGKTEAKSFGQTWKDWNAGHRSNSFPSLEKLETGVSFQLYDTVLRGGVMARDCLGFSYWL